MNKKFLITWVDYPGNPAPEIVYAAYFTEMDFDAVDIRMIEDLSPGESYVTGGPFDHVIIERTE